jgi:isoleucyl-tRNA synthetase
MDLYSADALRFALLSSGLLNGEDFTLKDKDVQDVQRKLAMIWNMYDFFTLYASVDGWEWDGTLDDPSDKVTSPLDKWVLSKVHQLQVNISAHMDAYDIPGALEPVLGFVDDASNWYVRRSRRRFWKSGNDADKDAAYRTLHYVLVRLSMILAPFVPFLTEELYQRLTDGESVHLLDWPAAGAVDEEVLEKMAFVRNVINEGLSQRAANKVKVRQPLQKVSIPDADSVLAGNPALTEIVLEELNVKEYADASGDKVELDLEITPGLKREGIMRELVRQVQAARKDAGLNVDDRIRLQLMSTDEEVERAIEEYAETLKSETLAASLNDGDVSGFSTDAKVDDFKVGIALAKV